uniref:ERI1 exoribonuclease 2 n=1 Tax=Scleropages formosus TaxID=113540 RepID=A0A8C9REY9_SCLFO
CEKRTAPLGQFFSFLIIIDFESTCWKERRSYDQEIIEFPAVLLNTSTGKIESEFHTYVQPQEHPILSDFCTELTGIKQVQVEAGVPLQICLSWFSRWLESLCKEKNIVFVKDNVCPPTACLCAFVTWSDWDLGICLQYECKRKQICKPQELNRWIDLRATYKLFYNRKPKGLNGALQDLGIEFSGREHSGLDDARNTAHLAWRMITDGCLMKVTKSLDLVSGFFLDSGSTVHQAVQKNPNLIKRDKEMNEFGCAITKRTPKQESAQKENNASTGMNSNTEVCQSLVAPKTLLDGFTNSVVQTGVHPQDFGISYRSLDRSSRSATVPSQVGTSFVLVSTTFNSIKDASHREAADAVTLVTESEKSPVLVESEEPFSYDDVILEDKNVYDTTCAEISGYVLNGMNSKNIKADLSPACANSAQPLQSVFESSNTTLYSATMSKPDGSSTAVFKMPLANCKPGLGAIRSCPSSSNFRKGDCGSQTKHSGFKITPSKSSFTIYKDDLCVSSLSSDSSHSTSSLDLSSLVNKTSVPSVRTVISNNIKVTAPLCNCGRRAKRLTVAKGGPNHGRVFYSCPVGKTGNTKGCGFFKWASPLVPVKSRTVASTSLCFKQTSNSLLSEKSLSNGSSPPLKKFLRSLRH